MNQPKEPHGNFVMNRNYKHNSNPKAPSITGRISTPEDKDLEYHFAAFQKFDDDGKRYWIGPVDMTLSFRHALTSDRPARGTNFVAIRENGFKIFKERDDGSPNPAYQVLTAEQQAKEDSKPPFWATWTRTDAHPKLRAAGWDRTSRYGKFVSGSVQHPLTKEQVEANKALYADADPEFADMVDEPAPAPRAARGKAASHERA
jgi:hypothetical protein